jgi:hypothetical protein
MTDTPISADPALEALAVAVAAAELTAAEANAAFRESEAARDVVRSRVQALDAARQEIRNRRAAGDGRDTDGADLELLALDQEILVAVLAGRDAAVTAARAEAEKAIRVLNQARHDLDHAEAQRTAAALVQHLEVLDRLLVEGVRQANSVSKGNGHGQTGWIPSVELMAVLTPLDAARPRW